MPAWDRFIPNVCERNALEELKEYPGNGPGNCDQPNDGSTYANASCWEYSLVEEQDGKFDADKAGQDHYGSCKMNL